MGSEERWSPDFLTGNHNLAREAAQAFAAYCADARVGEAAEQEGAGAAARARRRATSILSAAG